MQELKQKYYNATKTFQQIGISDQAYIYEVTDLETDHIYYEVFERRYNRRFDCISFPTDKAFGKWAWCISRGADHKSALKAALLKFELLRVQEAAA
ncbi:hypothetical protein [Flagellimonas meridianipacifica]|uniref:Uncharacterized protein n=1 Tax=Flagellimonas meridianipacifica TaxID=1080225 RepID=A0A2T0MAI2_9FLAO|nr:hypothetical protein [Allomuricauda pacifica]PRX54412.1 hypothetical protein CLV81_2813 [Allomuricauda pacifica]